MTFRLRTLAFTSLVAAASCTPPTGAPTPASCDEIHSAGLAETGEIPASGVYVLYVDGNAAFPWMAHCEMSTAATYLPLPRMATDTNFSELATADGTVRTTYQMVRVDTTTMTIDITDRRFAKSQGTATIDGAPISELPYGVAISGDKSVARANIDLRGTKFSIDELFGGTAGPLAYAGQILDLEVADGTWLAPDAAPSVRGYDAQGQAFQLTYQPCDGGCTAEVIEDDAADVAGLELVDGALPTP